MYVLRLEHRSLIGMGKRAIALFNPANTENGLPLAFKFCTMPMAARRNANGSALLFGARPGRKQPGDAVEFVGQRHNQTRSALRRGIARVTRQVMLEDGLRHHIFVGILTGELVISPDPSRLAVP